MRHRFLLVLLSVVLTGCSSSGSTPVPTTKTPPNLDAFLRLPVATPSSCPPSVPASTSGRRSPWVGHVDVSVFLRGDIDRREQRRLRNLLSADPAVRHVYAETRQQARAELARLYTCSAQVPASAARASYRLVLGQVTRAERDDLVGRLSQQPGVGSVSCDPSSPCVNVTAAG